MEDRIRLLVDYCKRVSYTQLANKFVLLLGFDYFMFLFSISLTNSDRKQFKFSEFKWKIQFCGKRTFTKYALIWNVYSIFFNLIAVALELACDTADDVEVNLLSLDCLQVLVIDGSIFDHEEEGKISTLTKVSFLFYFSYFNYLC